MKRKLLIGVPIALVLLPIFYFGAISMSARRPSNLGVTEGQLLPCPDSPNCVSSQTDPNDKEHYIEPLELLGTAAESLDRLVKVIESMPRTTVVSRDENYLHAEFTSLLFRYVDDVECYVDEEAGKIHVRSASRVGYSDIGANRKRVDAIRTLFSPR